MWLIDMEKLLRAVEEAEEAEYSEFNKKKERVIRLLMGDEKFLAEQTLESIADIINQDVPDVFDEYNTFVISPDLLMGAPGSPYKSRRRIL